MNDLDVIAIAVLKALIVALFFMGIVSCIWELIL